MLFTFVFFAVFFSTLFFASVGLDVSVVVPGVVGEVAAGATVAAGAVVAAGGVACAKASGVCMTSASAALAASKYDLCIKTSKNT
jgi:hypothetical protein